MPIARDAPLRCLFGSGAPHSSILPAAVCGPTRCAVPPVSCDLSRMATQSSGWNAMSLELT
jgi:hypothetical protein